ncbi:TorF family putative porin [Tahibacter harae]|uniref:TorF family putative porin n=1 Tax=Tahibacter harae TaxID=2963937 RepID=A0ABT1QN66_9GAMM|nr:TorF family putative porin [Tahibacter harae]MCQ4163887.1 TorF family putative porin [Tahibacter harae]
MTPFTPNCRGAAVLAAAVFAAPAAQALDFSGSAALTSDYVFRGISQTQGNAAPQLGARLVLDSGFYGALWGSSVDYGDAAGSDAEVDLVAGWNRTFAGRWNLDVNLTRFTYPGTRAPLNLDYNEVIATLALDQRWWLLLGWSENVLASGERGIYTEVGAKFPLGDRFRFETVAAHYDLDDAYGASYSRAQLSAIYTLGNVDLRASGHWTSDSAERIFPGVAGSRFEAAASWNF